MYKLNELWQIPGCVVNITEKYENKYLPRDFYVFVEKSEYGFVLYKDHCNYLLEEWEDNDEIQVSFKEPLMRIEALVEAKNAQILGLISDGWTLKEKYQDPLNLAPYYDELISLITLKEINLNEMKVNE